MESTVHFRWRCLCAVVVFAALGLGCGPALPNDLSSLIEAMASDDQTVSVNAAIKVHSRFGKEGLLTALRTGRSTAKQKAALHLRGYPAADVEQALLKTLEEEHEAFVRSAVLHGLGGVGTSASVPLVKRATLDAHLNVANAATTALEEIEERIRR